MKNIVKKTIILALLASSIGVATSKAQTKQAFPQLKWIFITQSYVDSIPFGYEPQTFKPELISCDKLAKDHPCFKAEGGEEFLLVGTYQNKTMKNPIYVLFSPGPSADPFFGIKDTQGREVWGTTADEMCINSLGVIYTAGHTDRMFNMRQKFILSEGNVREVSQPYFYVGIKAKTLKAIKLYTQKEGGEIVATLPKGYEIEVLLAEHITSDEVATMTKRYLVRTSFGLVGWLRLTDEETYGFPVVNELRYWGD